MSETFTNNNDIEEFSVLDVSDYDFSTDSLLEYLSIMLENILVATLL